MTSLQDRILTVLAKPDVRCVWPVRRSIYKLWLDDGKIPDTGLRLSFALWRLKARGLVEIKDGYVGAKP